MFDKVLERARNSKEEHQATCINSLGKDDTSWKRSHGRRDGLKKEGGRKGNGNVRHKRAIEGDIWQLKSAKYVSLNCSEFPVKPPNKGANQSLKCFPSVHFPPYSLLPDPVIYPWTSNSPSGAPAKGKRKEQLRPCFLWLRRLISLHLRINAFHSSKDDCSNVLNRVCACVMGNVQEHLGTVASVHGKWQLTEQTLPLAN